MADLVSFSGFSLERSHEKRVNCYVWLHISRRRRTLIYSCSSVSGIYPILSLVLFFCLSLTKHRCSSHDWTPHVRFLDMSVQEYRRHKHRESESDPWIWSSRCSVRCFKALTSVWQVSTSYPITLTLHDDTSRSCWMHVWGGLIAHAHTRTHTPWAEDA